MAATVAEVLWRAEVHFSNGLKPCKELVRSASPERALGKLLKRYPWADARRTKVLGQAECSAPVFTPTADYESERLVIDRKQPEAKTPLPVVIPEKTPAAKAWPTVTPGGFDSRGRRLLSEENARAAAILHHAGRQSWFQLAQVIGVNQDHLRKMARAFYPPGLSQRVPRIADGMLQVCCKRAKDLTGKDIRRSLLVHSPGLGWRWCPAGQSKLSEGDWCLRLDDLPTPADPVNRVDPS